MEENINNSLLSEEEKKSEIERKSKSRIFLALILLNVLLSGLIIYGLINLFMNL